MESPEPDVLASMRNDSLHTGREVLEALNESFTRGRLIAVYN